MEILSVNGVKGTEQQGLVLVSKGRRYKIYDDRNREEAVIIVERGPGKGVKGNLIVKVPRPRSKLQWKLIEYVCSSLSGGRSSLVPFVLENRSMMKLAEHFYRYKSRSKKSMRTYASVVRRFSEYVGKSPDELIENCLIEGIPNPERVYETSRLVDQFFGELEADDLAPGSLTTELARLKSFFRVNGIDLPFVPRYSLRVRYRDRAPRPEEVQRLIEVAGLREKAMIAMLATSGLRIGTLVKLKYRHVKEDLEAGRVPVHIHVEAEITKGKYCDYDTFINEEAARYLKLYLDWRRRGTDKIPPEEITDESPLFRTQERKVRPLSQRGASAAIWKVFERAGLDRKNGKMHEIRIHSLRKFFRTQMAALGVPSDYIEYMMGHKLSTYHDVQMKGVEFLRGVYASANLRIFQKPKTTLADVLKEIIRSRGEDPSKYLRESIMAGRMVLSEEEETEIYARAIWEMLRKEQILRRIPDITSCF